MFGASESDPGRRVEHSQSQKHALFLSVSYPGVDEQHDQSALF